MPQASLLSGKFVTPVSLTDIFTYMSRSSSSLPTEKCQTIREEGAEDGPMDQQISNCSLSKLIGRNTGGPSPTLVVLTSERR